MEDRSLRQRSGVARVLGVYDENGPVAGAQVVDLLTGSFASTTVTGTVSLEWIRSQHDSAAIQVRKVGYQDTTFLVMTGPTDTVSITLVMKRVTELPTVTTLGEKPLSPNMKEFGDHTKAGNGTFFTRDDIRLAERRGLVTVSELVSKSGRINPSSRGERGCITVIGHNGIGAVALPGGELSLYDGIEIYRFAEIPARYNMTAPAGRKVCMAIVVWDREKP